MVKSRPPRVNPAPPGGRLDRQRWLDAGLQAVAAHGPAGLRVMAIAQQLGVTKGSFYWHFRDLAGYQAALLAEWETTRTRRLIARVEAAGGDATARLRALLRAVRDTEERLALAVRAWATTNSAVATAVRRVDRRRLAYLARLLHQLGWSKADASTLAHWGYGAWLGRLALGSPRLTSRQLELLLARFAPG
ncbi:MAG: TetR/AcrR family transcriptional regulator [Deltaproteobacteria bacterium]|nr:TetR/AcrR family transcriptional regulator [Deltaproteobacteria bacterium]